MFFIQLHAEPTSDENYCHNALFDHHMVTTNLGKTGMDHLNHFIYRYYLEELP